MKVVNLINKLNEIGYDENTELTFSCVDGNSGEWYDIPFDEISYGEELTGEPYHNDAIDIGLDVDSVKDYIQAKSDGYMNDMIDEIREHYFFWRLGDETVKIWLVKRQHDKVIVTIMKNKSDGTYSFINLTKEHICPCRFSSVEEALLDMDKKIKEGTVLKYEKIGE